MVVISRSDDVRIQNRQRVISAVRRAKIASRTDIGSATGLSAATVSAITSDLISEGILETQTDRSSGSATGRGRPKVGLVIKADAAMVCAVYFQLNFVSVSLVDYSGHIVAEHTVEISTKDISAEDIKSTIIKSIDQCLTIIPRQRLELRRIEVGFQGVTDVAGTRVLWSPICDQRDIPVQQWLEAHFGVPARVANDCDMIAQALHWREPEKFKNNFATVLLAHGVGMGLFLGGGVINGISSSAVEFGHMTYLPDGALCRCGNYGCIEAYAGDYAIARRAHGQSQTTKPTDVMDLPDLTAVAAAARAGDENALAAVENAGAAIGTGLASLYAIVDSFPIVLVGRGAKLFELMETSIRKALGKAPGSDQDRRIDISCFHEEQPLVKEGCAVKALIAHDEVTATRRRQEEAAE